MIKKEMFIRTSDRTNLKWIKTISLYKGFNRLSSTTGFFIKAVSKKVKPPKIEYKGFKRKFFKKGDLVRALIVKTRFKKPYNLSKISLFSHNSTIIIKKKNITRSKYFFGLVSKNLKKKKIVLLFNKFFEEV